MKKHFSFIKVLLLAAILFSVLFVVACGNEGSYDAGDPGYSDTVTDSITSAYSSNRKIHFDISYYVDSKDVGASLSKLNKLMKDYEGYIESNNYNSYDTYATATYVIRIPSDKLDQFVAAFESGEDIESKSIGSTDYTTQYVDTTAQIQALEASRDRYQEMLEEPNITFSQVQNINEQLVAIETKLNALQIKKNNYDNLVEYATVTVRYNQTIKEKFFDAFDGYGEYIYKLCQVLVGIVLYTFPFAVIAAIVLGAIFVPKFIKTKKQNKKNKEGLENK